LFLFVSVSKPFQLSAGSPRIPITSVLRADIHIYNQREYENKWSANGKDGKIGLDENLAIKLTKDVQRLVLSVTTSLTCWQNLKVKGGGKGHKRE